MLLLDYWMTYAAILRVYSSTGEKSVAISPSNPSNIVTVTTDPAGAIVTVTAQAQSVAGSGSRSRSNLGPIIGSIIGALAVTTLIILFLCLRRRRVRRLEPQTDKAARREFLRIENYPLRPVKNALPTAREVGHSAPISFSTSGSKIRHRNNTSVVGLTGDPPTLSSPDRHTTPEHSSSSSDEPQACCRYPTYTQNRQSAVS
ncbi:hypothetical protein B0H14DRAFT_1229749 [Mycena olivaceomarginata]|nr:hypothetical protein B0H14DRAFT_1229749 [Mycena olivaceomarginata]